jgi:hypothetical protein
VRFRNLQALLDRILIELVISPSGEARSKVPSLVSSTAVSGTCFVQTTMFMYQGHPSSGPNAS